MVKHTSIAAQLVTLVPASDRTVTAGDNSAPKPAANAKVKDTKRAPTASQIEAARVRREQAALAKLDKAAWSFERSGADMSVALFQAGGDTKDTRSQFMLGSLAYRLFSKRHEYTESAKGAAQLVLNSKNRDPKAPAGDAFYDPKSGKRVRSTVEQTAYGSSNTAFNRALGAARLMFPDADCLKRADNARGRKVGTKMPAKGATDQDGKAAPKVVPVIPTLNKRRDVAEHLLSLATCEQQTLNKNAGLMLGDVADMLTKEVLRHHKAMERIAKSARMAEPVDPTPDTDHDASK